MALTGEAKRCYQRKYMRGYMRDRRSTVKTQAVDVKTPVKTLETAGVKTQGPSGVSASGSSMPVLSVKSRLLDDLRAKTPGIMTKPSTPATVEPARPRWRPGIRLPAGTLCIGPDGREMAAPTLDADGQEVPAAW